nr:uncharacterized protein LOC112001606 [Quercus suber]
MHGDVELFTVCSAYHLAMSQSFSSNRGTSSNNSTLKRFWKKIWSILVPHKIQHFVWRACRDALPTKNNLLRRKVIQEKLCESCKEAPKTVGHVLWSCLKAKEVWECSKLVISWNERVNQSFQDLMWNLLLNEDVGDDQVAQAVTIAWALWHNRNELRYGGEGKSGQHLTRWVADYLIEFRVAVAQNTPGVPVPRQVASWSPNKVVTSKLTLMGLFSQHRKRWELGWLLGMIKGGLR